MPDRKVSSLAYLYIAAFALVAVCFAVGAVGIILDWGETALLFLYAAGAAFGVLAVLVMTTYLLTGRQGRGDDSLPEDR